VTEGPAAKLRFIETRSAAGGLNNERKVPGRQANGEAVIQLKPLSSNGLQLRCWVSLELRQFFNPPSADQASIKPRLRRCEPLLL
jgi:hypothetical protein